MDTIFFNGCIRTLDNSEKVAEAVGIENGRIVFVGTDKEAEAFSCKKRIDLKGRLMLPGFVDTFEEKPENCRVLKINNPILTNTDLMKIMEDL